MNFFFQAEDGIRDTSVTGVQTCALPISPATASIRARVLSSVPSSARCRTVRAARQRVMRIAIRSEERRVGKECRCRGAEEKGKEKKKRQRGTEKRHGENADVERGQKEGR